MSVDVLAVGAHPDDVELGLGGTILQLASQGYSVAILDLTLGELSSRGTVEERMTEAQEAADILNVSIRHNAELPDGGLQNTLEQRREIIPFVRALRPTILMMHRAQDRHPDHRVASTLTRDANFFAGVTSIVTDESPWRAPQIFYYNPYYDDDSPPSLIMDISAHIDRKMEALEAYRSQLYNPDYEGTSTMVSSPEFWEGIRRRAAYWGQRIGVDYGEPLYTDGPLPATVLPGLEPLT